jgi:phage-related baseplate assembly protein
MSERRRPDITGTIDISKNEKPEFVPPGNFSELYKTYAKRFDELLREEGINDYVFSDSDPISFDIEMMVYERIKVNQAINATALQCLLPFSKGKALDGIATLFNIKRDVILDPSTGQPLVDPETGAPLKETDEELRRKILLSFEVYSTAGAASAYRYHTLKVGEQYGLRDTKPYSDGPGLVKVPILFSSELLALELPASEREAYLAKESDKESDALTIIEDYLNRPDIKPLTDLLTVEKAQIRKIEISAEILTERGVDPEIVYKEAFSSLGAYRDSLFNIGEPLSISNLYASLVVPNVKRVSLTGVTGDIDPGPNEAILLIYSQETVGLAK